MRKERNSSRASRLRNFELLADGSDRPLLNFRMARYAGNFALLRVKPDGVCATLAIENAALLAQMALQVCKLHASANSSVSRSASGERSFSANSRWHASTSLSASRRFAFASSRVSPCEIAAGISSTKQVYPPSLAGSNTAVSFTFSRYHTTPGSRKFRPKGSHTVQKRC